MRVRLAAVLGKSPLGKHTNTENIEAKSLEDGLVHQLIRETVKADVASQGQVSGSVILMIKLQVWLVDLNYSSLILCRKLLLEW